MNICIVNNHVVLVLFTQCKIYVVLSRSLATAPAAAVAVATASGSASVARFSIYVIRCTTASVSRTE